jgi:branched-chain amino acid transport system permease protein
MQGQEKEGLVRTGLRAVWPWLSLAVPIVVAALLISAISPAYARLVTDTLIKLIMVIGLYMFIGNSGLMSFGHGAFMIVGAYASAWLTITPTFKKVILPQLPQFLQAAVFDPITAGVIAVTLSALLAFIVGMPLMRLSGIAASIATFAFFIVISVIYNNWTSWTKGTASLVGLPVYVGPYSALVAALVVLAVANIFRVSRYGLFLRATREDAVAARATGLKVEKLRLIAFVLSASICAVGGILWGHNNGALTTANNVYFNLTFLTIAMLVVGGMRSMAGAACGTILLATVSELLRQLERGVDLGGLLLKFPPGSGQVALGLCMLLVLILRPEGLTRGREIPLPQWLRPAGERGGQEGGIATPSHKECKQWE